MELKKVAGLLLVLFWVSSCSCSKKSSIVITNKGNTNSEEKEDNNENTDKYAGGTPELAFYNLKILADKEFKDVKNIDASATYVEGLISLEYSSDKVTYFAEASYNDDMYLAKLTLNYSFVEEDEFIYEITNLNLRAAHGRYNVTAEVIDMVFEESISDKFFDNINDILPEFDENKAVNFRTYKLENDYYIATTYNGTDSGIYSINEIRYNSDLDNFQFSSGYSVVGTGINKMYSLLEMFLV